MIKHLFIPMSSVSEISVHHEVIMHPAIHTELIWDADTSLDDDGNYSPNGKVILVPEYYVQDGRNIYSLQLIEVDDMDFIGTPIKVVSGFSYQGSQESCNDVINILGLQDGKYSLTDCEYK